MSIVVRFVKTHKGARIPVLASDGAAAYDLAAHSQMSKRSKTGKPRVLRLLENGPVVVRPGQSILFGTGIIPAIPPGYVADIRPRSGLALRHEITIPNSPGTVDADFRYVIGVQLRNDGDKEYVVRHGDRIAQMIVHKCETVTFREVPAERLGSSVRGARGWGSTGNVGTGLWTGAVDKQILIMDRFFLRLAYGAAAMSNCVRGCPRNAAGEVPQDEEGRYQGQTRRYGCVITKGLRVCAIGNNRQTPGEDSCALVECLRDKQGIKTGTQIEVCRAQHAEQAAIGAMQESFAGATIYITAAPCLFCARQIAGLKEHGLEALVVLQGEYPNNGLDVVRKADIIVREVTVPEIPILKQLEELMATGFSIEQITQALEALKAA